MKTLGVILSAGIGARFKDKTPKQYHYLGNHEVISYVIDALKESDKIDDIVVVCGDEFYRAEVSKKYNVETILGGDTRNKSVKNAILYAREKNVYDKILFFDSARPNQNKDYINECVQKLEEYDCVITTQYITDSLCKFDDCQINRKDYFLVQTPECFLLKNLDKFDENSDYTAIVQQLPKTSKIYCNYNLPNNIKITYENDIEIAKVIMKDKLWI